MYYHILSYSAYCEGEFANSMSIDQLVGGCIEHEQSVFRWMSQFIHSPSPRSHFLANSQQNRGGFSELMVTKHMVLYYC